MKIDCIVCSGCGMLGKETNFPFMCYACGGTGKVDDLVKNDPVGTKPKLNVIDFPGKDLTDIPKMLRELADAIENGKHGEVSSTIVVMVCDTVSDGTASKIFGFGDVEDSNKAATLLSVAHYKMIEATGLI